MERRIVKSKGRTFMVNVAGWADEVGPGNSVGTLWMSTDTGSWYQVQISGSAPNAALFISQSKLPYGDNSLGYQLLQIDNTPLTSSLVYVSGTPPAVTFNVSQSTFNGLLNPKPDLLLQSITDGNFYIVYLHQSASVIQALVNQTYVSASWVYQSGIY